MENKSSMKRTQNRNCIHKWNRLIFSNLAIRAWMEFNSTRNKTLVSFKSKTKTRRGQWRYETLRNSKKETKSSPDRFHFVKVPWLPAGTRQTVVSPLAADMSRCISSLRHRRHVVRFGAGVWPEQICNQQCRVTARGSSDLDLTSRRLDRDSVACASGEVPTRTSARIVRFRIAARCESIGPQSGLLLDSWKETSPNPKEIKGFDVAERSAKINYKSLKVMKYEAKHKIIN